MFGRLIFLGLWLPVTIGLFADEISLVRVGEVWSYRTGTNSPSTPITAWRGAGFDDSGWLTGTSGFTTLASTDFYEATILPQPVGYRSVFIRRKFSVSDPGTVQWLILRLNYDDGFVAYLNGVEIARHGLTNDPVAFDDYADPHIFHQGGAAEDIDVSASKGLLQPGTNVLAIEVHTAITNEAGNTNGMRLVPELLANFERGPFIQNATTNSMQVIWRTPVPADSVVDFGTNQTLSSEISDAALTTNHVVTLTNLQPGSQYYYSVRSTAGTAMAVSATNSFRTLKMNGDLTFLVLGDTGTGLPFPTAGHYQVAAAMQQVPADLVLQSGDAIDIPYFTFGLEDTRFLSVFRQQMQSIPFFLTMGNHEVDNGALGTTYLATFYLPTNSVTGTSHYYSFDHGDAHFVAVYMPFFISIPQMEPYRLYEGSAQYNWLTNDLASSSKPWKILYLHHPLATSGSHRTDVNNGSQLTDCEVLSNMLLPVAKRYGVELILSGHDHHYERFIPIDGVQLIDNGAGGSFMDNIRDGLDPASSQFYGVPGFLKVAIQGDELFLQAFSTNGNVFDYMTLRRSVPPPQVYESTWHTPLVETTPANDGHGNINGQTFDFIGNPIRTLAGQFSNLGRVYVNNDFTNLFIGFEQSMFYSNNNVFLFIDTPGQSGVTNLIGLGDGIAGSGQGVDGLDFLENLSFTNFAPSVACVLGDEFADEQLRHFTRPGMTLDMGQGVFRLNSAFNSVMGIRLQQFNRSPQALGLDNQTSFPERNADFIEVAIPYSRLGGLEPGDTIKIAAVVGLAGYDTNAQTRELDTSFLGSSMTGSGQSNVVLGAVSVHLSLPVLTVKADDKTRGYGATNPPLTVTYSGFKSGDDPSVLSGGPSLSTVANTNSPIGAYAITVSQGTLSNAQYSFSFTNGTLTVTQALLGVVVSNQMRSYGATNPLLTGTVTGIKNGDNITAIFTTTADTNTAVGSYAIVPMLSGAMLTNYAVVISNGTMTITPALLTVSADNKSRLYGTTNPVFTGVISGIQNNDAIAAVYNTPATPSSPVGSYAIVPMPSGTTLGNYVVTTNNGTLTVTAASLLVQADDQFRPYGQTNNLTARYSGFGMGQGTNILTGSPLLSTTADTNSPVGIYPINISQGTLAVSDTNYSLVFSNGTLTVTQAVLIVKADSQTRSYGTSNAPLTFEYVGFVNGDGKDIVTGSPVLNTAADTNSPIGDYPITVSLGTLSVTDTNYNVLLINGMVTVTQAVLYIIADNQSRSYGATNAQFTGTISGIQNGDPILVVYTTVADTNSPVGNYAIVPTASGAFLTNYAITISNGTLVVLSAPLSVSADNKSRIYGTTNPPLTGTIMGIQNNDAITFSFDTPAVVSSPTGVYPIIPNPSGGTLGNYAVVTNNGVLTVTRADLLVKADDTSRGYGQTNILTASYSGLGELLATNIFSGTPALTTTAETNSPTGAYEIAVSAGTLSVTDTNFDLTFSNGTLTVTQAILTVKADDKTRSYGANEPPLTFSYSGFVNGEGTNIVSGSPNLSTETDTNSSPGTYAISVRQGTLSLSDTNYSLLLVNGVLTITQASSTNAVVSSLNPSTTGDNVNFTANVGPVPPSTTLPTGNVTFLTNDAVLGVVPLTGGIAGISTRFLPPGTNALVAAYTGDSNYSGSTNSLQQSVTTVCSSTNFTLSIATSPTNTFTFTVIGTSNAQYRLIQTSDLTVPLTNWTVAPGSTNIAFDGLWQYAATNGGGPAFFRVQAVTPCP
jgi:hypothetical protein